MIVLTIVSLMFFLNISSLLNVFQVRWADVEEKMQQKKIRDLGFVVGQTNWSRMTDPTFGESALTKTKYI